jgi:hypothetical protein
VPHKHLAFMEAGYRMPDSERKKLPSQFVYVTHSQLDEEGPFCAVVQTGPQVLPLFEILLADLRVFAEFMPVFRPL